MSDLYSAADRLNELIKRAEHIFGTIGVSGDIWLTFTATVSGRLAFKKVRHEWKLMWIVGDNESPLTNTSLELRLFTVGYLPNLYETIIRNRQNITKDIEGANASLEAFLDRIEESSSVH